ncbi:MAG: hypothetical protein LIP28_02980 [Deltaproteobacteria bacterium]|nr:hypothetical protein [Deltaproteobacteria bacterium]
MTGRVFLFLLCAGLAGCGAHYTPSIRLALDGPPLHVAMRDDASAWFGLMDRGCMAGFGTITLHGDGTTCQGQMDHPANDKGRLYADLLCTTGDTMTLVIRNLGPDQGMGLARINPEEKDGRQMTLFYHPSAEEAKRRLAEVRAEIAAALEEKRRGNEPAAIPPAD